MNLAALISGGKDSMLALYKMHKAGHEIRYLLTMKPESTESYMFHHPNIWVTGLISKSMGIPLLKDRTQGRKEEELEDLKTLLEHVAPDVDGIVSGALASSYQKTRIDSLCEGLRLKSLSPLWHLDPSVMWEELFDLGFEVMITSVAAEGLDGSWLGKIVEREAFRSLTQLSKKYRFHLGFEGGEAETLVLDMPLYRKRIIVKDAKTHWDGRSGTYKVKEAVIEEKG